MYPGPNGDYVFANGKNVLVRRITAANIATGTTDGSVIAASSDATLKIRILGISIQIGNIATNVTVKSKVGANASTAMSPAWEFGANGGIVLQGVDGEGVMADSDAGAAVTLTTSGAGATTHVTGTYCYC